MAAGPVPAPASAGPSVAAHRPPPGPLPASFSLRSIWRKLVGWDASPLRSTFVQSPIKSNPGGSVGCRRNVSLDVFQSPS
eukprot:5515138-Amphidinium_carterae.1